MTQTDTITFQLATHFLSKLALRLESLFHIIHEACQSNEKSIHRYAIKNMIEIMDIIEKPELKSRFIKELVRIEHTFNKCNTCIDEELKAHLIRQIQILNHHAGHFGDVFAHEDFLKSLRQAHHPGSQECEFNNPQIMIWLDLPSKQRQADLKNWVDMLSILENTVIIYLELLRVTAFFNPIAATNGFCQYPLPPRSSCHLIQLKLDKNLLLVPKLQLGHNGLSIRLHELHSLDILHQASVNMEIAISQV